MENFNYYCEDKNKNILDENKDLKNELNDIKEGFYNQKICLYKRELYSWKDLNKSLEYYTKAIKLNKNNVNLLIDEWENAISKWDYKKASIFLEKAFELVPEKKVEFENKFTNKMASNSADLNNIEYFYESIKLNEKNIDLFLNKCIELIIVNKNYNIALEYINKISKLKPEFKNYIPEINNIIRWSQLLESWNTELALNLFNNAIKMNSKNVIIYNKLIENTKYWDNLEIINEAISKDENNSDFLKKKLKIWNSTDINENILILNKLISLNPNDYKNYLDKAILLKTNNKNHEALELLDRGINTINGDISELYIYKRSILEKMSLYDEAINTYEKAISLSNDNHYLYAEILDILKIQNKNAKYAEILAKSQNNIWYYEIELNSLENNEKYNEALEIVDKMLKLENNEKYIEKKLNILMHLWKYNEVINEINLNENINKNPKILKIQLKALYEIWNYEKSVELSNKLINIDITNLSLYEYKYNSFMKLWKNEDAIKVKNEIENIFN